MESVLSWIKAVDPYVAGLILLGIIWLIVALLTGSARIWRVAVGRDGRFSTSKLQQFIWTAAVLYSYGTVFVARAHAGRLEPINEIPENVLIALGLSVGTAILAAGITSSHVEQGQEVKVASGASRQGVSALVEDDSGRVDLAKIQLLAWTVVAVMAYLFSTADVTGRTLTTAAEEALPGLPDIDATLMVLSGLGQGAYIGKKLVTRTRSGITSISPTSAAPETLVTLTGVNFGDAQGGNVLTMRDKPIAVEHWSSDEITFQIPAVPPWGGAWSKTTVEVNLIVDGQIGANAVYLEVVPAV
jgi:hypothetical protein